MNRLRYLAVLITTLGISVGSLQAQTYGELIGEAMQLRNEGQFAEAETLFRRAHQAASDQRESYFLLAMTIAFQQRFDEAEALLNQGLARYPEDIDLKISLARVESFKGDFAGSRSTVDQVLRQDPTNTEAHNLAGRLSLYQNQASGAVEHYSQTLALDAENLEAQIGLHDAYRAMGEEYQASLWLARAALIAPDNVDVRTRQDQRAAPERSWQVSYGYGNSHFQRLPLSDWYESFVEAHRQDGRGNDMYFRAESLGHFGMSDTLLAAGAVRNMSGNMPWGGRLEYSPDAVFVPDYRVNLFVSPLLRESSETWGTTVTTISAQFASYPTAQVSLIGLSLDQYLFNGQLWLTPALTTVLDENDEISTGWNMQANLLVNDNLLLGAGYGESPQTENAVTANTRTTHLFGKVTLSDRMDVRVDWVREDRENSYLRYGATFALIWKY